MQWRKSIRTNTTTNTRANFTTNERGTNTGSRGVFMAKSSQWGQGRSSM
jgi:hypothetical protein